MINTVGFQRSECRQETALSCACERVRADAHTQEHTDVSTFGSKGETKNRHAKKEKDQLNYCFEALLRVFKYDTLQIITVYSFSPLRQWLSLQNN